MSSWSVRLITIRGIPIRVHASFIIILAWAAYLGISQEGTSGLRGAAYMVSFVLLLFVCVVLHELGHSMVAQWFGVKVEDITLWPIGGVARMSRLPEKPVQEFLIAAAGPAVNLILAGLLGVILLLVLGPSRIIEFVLTPRLLARFMADMTGLSLLTLLVANNLLLALFNLIPAFPMDGGRLLRSLLAAFFPFGRATRIASFVGQGFAALIGAAAIYTGDVMLMLVALFVFVAAWQERQLAVGHDTLRGVTVEQVMQPIGPQLHPLETLADVAARTMTASQSAFLVVDGGKLAGLLYRSDLLGRLRRHGAAVRVSAVMRTDFLRMRPADAALDARDYLLQRGAVTAVVIGDGKVVGLIGRAELARAAEMLEAYPEAARRP